LGRELILSPQTTSDKGDRQEVNEVYNERKKALLQLGLKL
jgi:hypothetical protein